MDYILKIPGPLLDRVPLYVAASAMANAEVGGIPKGKSRDLLHEKCHVSNLQKLLDAAQSGALMVCDSKGILGSFDDVIDRARSNGMLLTRLPEDQGGGDWEAMSFVTALYSRLVHLNKWAATNSDNFILSDEPALSFVHIDDDHLPIPVLRLAKPAKCGTQPAGEPPMEYGKNKRADCIAWIQCMAKKLSKVGDSHQEYGKRIIDEATCRGYRMERGGQFTMDLILSATKPAAMGNKGGEGITGGRKANPGRGRKKIAK